MGNEMKAFFALILAFVVTCIASDLKPAKEIAGARSPNGRDSVTVTLMDGTQKTVPFRNNLTLYQVIADCCGFDTSGRPRHATIIRSGTRTKYDLRQRYSEKNNPKLQPGDRVEFEKPKFFSF
jgi:hypothetical protein